ncbi:hypothetical protein A2630_04150 [Candidatus Woesebacteria bacterium RIFCSPHIGHO2_01_FULL_44_10]|uniref:Plasmid stabilization protein n=1 Tax=Candidatus Woesebacteria bacterium RIFCSPLOWO2_01_FULL_44_14 TaxID=1802525 RepID=A0A1F8C399_9BACT|nr:MAG: hypothetical protein A2630_04150 [Candidatus Woesebacteria bacterium RIFCSPHIGHO2_01_FULL_44_10]OGM55464.1 MAG: hypothetical protein A3F62_00545 [Candidatus Woesebacteria bacterium RIFCSPHIGHO2_12_FULL_44_11]OGM70128.1 MAG: hypothetical protein A2975_03565 [Candidatus Woesebacteria bacterium RIFCSPLOWO2_01_FULL_44_14]
MRLFYTNRFEKLYKKLPEPIKTKLNRQLGFLAQDLRHPGLRAKKVSGAADVWEGRVDIHYRFTY